MRMYRLAEGWRWVRKVAWVAALALPMSLSLSPGAVAADALPTDSPPAVGPERLQITEPYLELHTGPGRGYPVSHVVMRHEWVVVELRHTDWFRVRTDKGVVGWAVRDQLASTLTASGVQKTFRDVLVDDFLRRRVHMGVGWGRLEGEPLIKAFAGVRLSESLSVEAALSQVQGKFVGMDEWHLDLVAEPWSDQRWSPFVAVGVGRFKREPNASLVNDTTLRAKQGHAALGLNWHISDRFIARADWGLHTVYYTDTLTNEYRAWSLGVAFFF
ncbi:MAG: hypothetical protein RI907_1383 [Pseudomonadota bacterium]